MLPRKKASKAKKKIEVYLNDQCQDRLIFPNVKGGNAYSYADVSSFLNNTKNENGAKTTENLVFSGTCFMAHSTVNSNKHLKPISDALSCRDVPKEIRCHQSLI